VTGQALLDLGQNLVLALFPKLLRGNYVGIMRAPIADADLAVFADDILEGDRRTGGSVKQSLALIGGGPLRAGDEVLAPRLGGVTAAAGFHEAVDQSALLICWYGFHKSVP
jgi:hypothetical protein